ncbi:Cytochrome b5 [Apostasia shenzhenica]|uniref:Cytochrome b5 n=1 Tax=Apostasia shenzhenica TaxID=1088818 RepID=A0A2I0B8X8_9ASPA|nr:Cytochrome b5 [Apostasia shenzhenica]
MDIILVTLLLAALLGASFLFPRLKGKGKVKEISQTITKETLNCYTKQDVSVHNKRNDCWIIIKDKVYDVSPYVEEHPGGDAILKHAGGDSTEGFFGPQHATRVFDMIDEFYVGDLIS